MSKTLRWSLLLAIALLLTVVGAKYYFGPTVDVLVTTVARGRSIPMAGVDVELWNCNGVIQSETDAKGLARFTQIMRNSRWVPSLGPFEGCPQELFSVSVRAYLRLELDGVSRRRDLVPAGSPDSVPCPNVTSDAQHFSVWNHQNVEILLPSYATIEIDFTDPRVLAGRRRYLRYRTSIGSGKLNLDAERYWCMLPGEAVEAELVIDGKTRYRWPAFDLLADRHLLLTVDDADVVDDS